MLDKKIYMTGVNKSIGHRIYIARKSKTLSMSKISKLIGVSQHQLYKYEKGINSVSVARMVLIADVLGQNIDYFYADVSPKGFRCLT